MNTLNTLRSLTFVVFIAFSSLFADTASAITVRIVEGGTIGMNADLTDPSYTIDLGGGNVTIPSYFAGIVTLDIDGVSYQGIMDDPLITPGLTWQTNYTSWEGTIYTRNDILSGARVVGRPEAYSRASTLFLDALLGYNPADPLWTASYNEMVWETMINGVSLWRYSDKEYPSPGSGVTMHDVYNSYTGLSSTVDYSFWMSILQSTADPTKEFIIIKSSSFQPTPTPPTVPIPPAIWLFVSGVLGMGLISRTRKKQK